MSVEKTTLAVVGSSSHNGGWLRDGQKKKKSQRAPRKIKKEKAGRWKRKNKEAATGIKERRGSGDPHDCHLGLIAASSTSTLKARDTTKHETLGK